IYRASGARGREGQGKGGNPGPLAEYPFARVERKRKWKEIRRRAEDAGSAVSFRANRKFGKGDPETGLLFFVSGGWMVAWRADFAFFKPGKCGDLEGRSSF